MSVFSTWAPSVFPTQTVISSVDPTHAAGLLHTLASATAALATATAPGVVVSLLRAARGAQASLTLISAQNALASPTASQQAAQASQAAFNATLNLQALAWEENLFATHLNMGGNVFFTAIFGVLMLVHLGLTYWSRYFYFGISAFLCCGLEFAGYLARCLAVHDTSNENYFLCQFICLTIAPVFILAGVYYYLAQILALHGNKYAMLKPLWFTYVFVCCDVASLVIQAIGGGMAGEALNELKSTEVGTHIMVAGIGFQVLSMLVFIFFLFDFIHRAFFHASPSVVYSPRTFVELLFQTRRGDSMRKNTLDPYYNPRYADARRRPHFGLAPFVILASVVFIYIRCIYRVVELSQGWTGFLITHEKFVMSLDAMMIFLACAWFVPFHPFFLVGREHKISLGALRKGLHEEDPREDDERLTRSTWEAETPHDSPVDGEKNNLF